MRELSKRLKQYRLKNDLTQRYVAYRLGTTQQAVGKWESGESFPRTERLIRLSEMIGCTVDELLKE